MQYKYAEIGDTVYFWFAANETDGDAGDGADPIYDVRLAGAAANAAPTASGTATLLSHANYGAGLHEIAIDSTGYAAGEYAVFCSITISTVNPGGFVGSFKLSAAGASLNSAMGLLAHADYGLAKLVRSTTPANTLTVDANHLVAVPATQKVDVETIKTQAVTCAAGVTVGAYVGGTGAAALASEVTAARMGALTDWIDGNRLDLILDAIKTAAEAVDTLTKAAGPGDLAAILTDTGTTLDGTLTRINKIIGNKMEVTDADGATVLYDDDNSTPLYSVAACITDNATTTTRKRLA